MFDQEIWVTQKYYKLLFLIFSTDTTWLVKFPKQVLEWKQFLIY